MDFSCLVRGHLSITLRRTVASHHACERFVHWHLLSRLLLHYKPKLIKLVYARILRQMCRSDAEVRSKIHHTKCVEATATTLAFLCVASGHRTVRVCKVRRRPE